MKTRQVSQAGLRWQQYRRGPLGDDLVAALIVTLLLVPQSLAYALLAGLPPVVGVMASLLPIVAYAAWGSSSTLAVGPVAVLALLGWMQTGNSDVVIGNELGVFRIADIFQPEPLGLPDEGTGLY